MRGRCDKHQFACLPEGWSLYALVQHLEKTSWAGIVAPRDPAAAEDEIPALGPKFDKGRRVLTVHGKLVRQFYRDAENQIPILKAFQEQNWPPWIENPLGRPKPTDARHRLSDAVADLNEDQKEKLVRFWIEKGTQRIFWELIEEACDHRVVSTDARGK